AGTVNDGAGADINFQSSTTSISANWSGFSDSGSGIASYSWAIGTTPGGTNILAFTNIGNVTSRTQTGLTLTSGTTYYVSVKATDNAGNVSSVATSNGVSVDSVAPTTASVTTPVGGSSFRAANVPATFSGSAADNSGGAGLNANSTTFTLRRSSDSNYWTGSAWQTA